MEGVLVSRTVGASAFFAAGVLSGAAFAQFPSVTPYAWRSVATRGMGTVTGIAISPASPYDVYIKADVGGAYRYDRTSDLWIPVLDSIGLGGPSPDGDAAGIGVESVAVDPTNGNVAYVVVNYASGTTGSAPYASYTETAEVLRTGNRGVTWTPLGLAPHLVRIDPNGNGRSTTGERLGVDPVQPSTLYFASRVNGLWRKQGSAAWAQVTGGLPDPASLPNYVSNGSPDVSQPGFAFVAFDRRRSPGGAHSAAIYVGVTGSGIWASADGGATWTNRGGPTDSDRGTVAPDGTLYVGARSSFQKLTAAGWTDISPVANTEFNGATVDPVSPGTVMTLANNRVFRSTDAGATWAAQRLYMGSNDPAAGTPVNPSAPGYYLDFASNYGAAIAIDPAHRGAAWWTNGFGVARTDDAADLPSAVWSWHMRNLEELVVNTIRVPPLPRAAGGADLLTGTDDMLGFRYAARLSVPSQHFNPVGIAVPAGYGYANGNWTVFPVPFPQVAGVTSMDYAATVPQHMAFVGQHQFEFIGIHGTSSDNGRTWQAFPNLPADTLYDSNGNPVAASAIAGQVAMSPTNPANMIWAPAYGSYPQVTFDGGRHWSLMTNLDHGPAPAPGGPTTNAQTHFTDIGPTFANSISSYVVANVLAADRADPAGATFYYLDFTTLYITHDGGATWRKGATGPNFPAFIVHPTVLSNPAKPGDVWLAFGRNATDLRLNPLFHSTDGGMTFATVAGVTSCDHATFGAPSAAGGPPTLFISGRVGADTADAVYKSADLGHSWVRISDPTREAFPGLQTMEGDMRTPGLVYLGLAGRGVLYGTPSGL